MTNIVQKEFPKHKNKDTHTKNQIPLKLALSTRSSQVNNKEFLLKLDVKCYRPQKISLKYLKWLIYLKES